MLQAIRGKSASWIVKILLVLLILSFAAWGIEDYIGVSFSDRAPVAVAGEEVPVELIDRPFRQQVSAIQRNLGGDFTLEQGMQMGILDQVIARVGTRTAMDRFVSEIGLVASDETIKTALRQTEAFQDESGNFDRARFEGALFQSGLSEQAFLAQLQQDIVHQQLLAAIGDGVVAPDPAVAALFRYRNEERVVDFLEIPFDSIRDIPTPSEQDLADHREAYGSDFETPEYRTIRLLALTPETVESDVLVTEEEVRAAYENRLQLFTTPERRTVRQIVLPDEESAARAAERVRAGESFDAVAVELAGMERADTELGAVSAADLFGETGPAVFQAPVGSVTDPIETAFGWHVFLIEDSVPGSVQPFDTVMDALENELRRERALDIVFELINDVEDIHAGGGSLSDIAAELNLDVIRLDALGPDGTLRDASAPANLTVPLAEVARVAFSTEPGTTSHAEQVGEAAYAVVHVDEVIEPVVPPLDEIRDRVAASWRAEQRQLLAIERAEDIVAQAREGVTVEALAAEHGLALRNSPPFKRTGEGLATLPRSIAGVAFAQETGDAGLAEGPNAVYVVQLTEVRVPDPSEQDEQVASLSRDLADGFRSTVQGGIAAAVVGRYPIEVNREALVRLYGTRGGGGGGN